MKFTFTGLMGLSATFVMAGCISGCSVGNSGADEKISLYDQMCNQGDGIICTELGHIYLEGKSTAPDINKANVSFQKACEQSNGTGCFNLGVSYANGRGVQKDLQIANSYYEKACNLNNGEACFNLGSNYVNSDGVMKDYHKANA